MFLVTPAVAAMAGPVYLALATRLSRKRLVLGTLGGGAVAMATFYALAGLGPAVDYALYLSVAILSGFLIGQVWMVASDRFTSRDARRVFALVGAGGTAADIVVGAIVAFGAARWGAESLLALCVVLLLGGAACAAFLERSGGTGWEGPGARRPSVGAPPASRIPGTGHLRLIAMGTVFGVLVVTLIDYQFKAIAASAFGTDHGGMASWFGVMSVGSGAVALTIQLFATPTILRHAGVAGALLVLPLALGMGEVALFLAPGLLVATLLKGGEESLRFSLHDAASQLAFVPVPSGARQRLRARLDTLWRPGAQMAVGGALLAYGSTAVGPLVALALLGTVAWLIVGWRLRAAYRTSIAETLRSRPAAFDGVDPPAEELAGLRDALADENVATRLASLEVARPVAGSLVAAITPSLSAAHPEVRRAAARALVGTRFDGWAVLAGDPALHDVALAALAARGDATALATLRVASDTVHAFGPGTEGILAAALPNAPPPLAAAIHRRLGDLASPAAIAALLPLLADAAACRSLARCTRRSLLAETQVTLVESRIRAELHAAFQAMAAADATGKAETALAADGTREANPFRRDAIGAVGLLSKALRERQEAHRERVLWLVAARWPGGGLDRVRNNLLEPAASRRANAVELLDSTLRGELRTLVVALVDDTPRYEKLAVAARLLELSRPSHDASLAALLRDASPFVAACAAYYVEALDDAPRADTAMMPTIEKVMLLRGVEIFAAVEGETLAAIAGVATEAEVAAGEKLVAEGEHGDALFVVVSGRARLTTGSRVLGEVGERAVIGEVALLDPGPRTADVVALTDLRVLRIGRDEFVELLAAYPEVSVAVIRMLARRMRQALG